MVETVSGLATAEQRINHTRDSTDDPITDEEIFAAHEGGKISMELNLPLETKRELSIAYTPGVARVSREIAKNPEAADRYTWASRLVAVVSDGTAVLGLGDIGPSAALPVMEGKCELFRHFGGLNAIPLVLDTKDPDEIIETIMRLRPSIGAVNLEDISSPRCFDLERRLIDALDIPVMHDDQHGTAVVVLAGIRNACRLTNRKLADLRVVVSGAGAAGVACTSILLNAGVRDITVTDSSGIIYPGRKRLNHVKAELAQKTNLTLKKGGIGVALQDADVFIGVSGGTVPEEAVKRMAKDAIIFTLSNPDPEIPVEVARRYAAIIATGRSDYPNQVNNVLAFPGIFRGALDSHATAITKEMKLAAANAIANVITDAELRAEYIIPSAFDERVARAVTVAVMDAVELSNIDSLR